MLPECRGVPRPGTVRRVGGKHTGRGRKEDQGAHLEFLFAGMRTKTSHQEWPVRLTAILCLFAAAACTRAQVHETTPARRPVAIDTSLTLEARYPRPLRGYRLDCLTPPDSTGACVLRDQRIVPR